MTLTKNNKTKDTRNTRVSFLLQKIGLIKQAETSFQLALQAQNSPHEYKTQHREESPRGTSCHATRCALAFGTTRN